MTLIPGLRVSLPNNWNPRPYQRRSWEAWERGCKRQLLIWHRRAGKDDVALHKAAVAAHLRPANYWHCLPKYSQARLAIWDAVNPHTGKKRVDEAFPHTLRKRTDSHTMTIEFRSGSVWRVVGSDNPDSLVGSPPAGIVFSEWALSNPACWAYLSPILAENGGWADFITTPRGRNHVKGMLDRARVSDWSKGGSWFSEVLSVDDTGAISPEAVEEARADYRALYGSRDMADALIDQEYYCSFEAAVLGSYYGRELVDAEKQGRLCPVPYVPGVPVHTAWDLGVGDDTSIWCFQEFHQRVNILAFYTSRGYAVDHYVDWLNDQPWVGDYGWDFVPPDARQREFTNAGPDGVAKSRIMTMVELGRRPKVVPGQRVIDGVNAARRMLAMCWFDAERCEDGLNALREYRREWDDDRKVFKPTPLHDWSSHPADAFRYLALAATNVPDPTPVVVTPEPPRGPQTLDEMIRAGGLGRRADYA